MASEIRCIAGSMGRQEVFVHVFITAVRCHLRVELAETRLQTMEVAGREILTRDKVSLRLNLTELWQVTDAVKARSVVRNASGYVYKELPLALRAAVSSRTLDELLTEIRRREETAATRSLLNTARLMEENPTLLRLKELETLEKVTEKVGSLTVYGVASRAR